MIATFAPKIVKEVERVLLDDFDAIKLSKEDERITLILQDPYCPDIDIIKGVYIIYKKSMLELLEGKIRSIHSAEFLNTRKQD